MAASTTSVFDALSLQQNVSDSVANSLLSAGITFMQNKKYDRAAQAFRAASAMKPDLTQAYTNLGAAYSSLGKNKEAIAAYKLSLKVDKTQDTVYTTLANLYIDQKQSSDAMKVLKDGIKQNNQNTLAYYTLGQLQSQSGDYASAVTNFKQVIKLEPKNANGFYALGMALDNQGKYNEGITQLQKATSLKKDFVAAIYELGHAYYKNGDEAKAKEQIDSLNSIASSSSLSFSSKLQNEMAKPKMYYYDSVDSSLELSMGPVSLLAVDSSYITAGTTHEVKASFAFDSDMDPTSIMNVTNWSITKASGGTAGIYNNGLYSDRNIPVPTIPSRVTYDATNRTATVVFPLTQNATGDGIIDPSHLVFKFLGKSQAGVTIDESADQYDGFSGEMF
jgi:Flp pilus assembly protein TadD